MSTKHQCSESVPDSTGFGWYPCAINATIQRGETWYCWQHDPERKPRERKPTRRVLYEQRRDANAQLGALVRAGLEQGISVHRLESGKYMCSTRLSWCAVADTPEDALKIAGVSLNSGA